MTLSLGEFLRRFLLHPASGQLPTDPQLRLPGQPAPRDVLASLLLVARRGSANFSTLVA
jgi:hypothetical protein